MPDTLVEVSHESCLQRLVSSIGGVVAGLLLFVLGFPLLWWNEARAVKTERSLGEGAAAVVAVGADRVDPAHEGRLVHLSGTATTEEALTDPQFGVSARAIKLRRKVQMFQWQEETRTEERQKVGGGSEKVTTTSYSKAWSDHLIDSSRFKSAVEHRNPASMSVESTEQVARRVTVGAFTLSDGLVASIGNYQPVPPGAIPPGAPHGLRLDGGGFYLGLDPARPEVGDLRISFEVAPETAVSVVARQTGSALGPYQTRAGRSIEMLEVGVHPADQMFKAAMGRNRVLTWVLRFAGWLLLFVGLATMLRPFAVLAGVIPLLGTAVRAGVGFFAAVVALVLALCVIAVAWVAYRPLLGGGLLAGAVAVIVLAVVVGRKRRAKAPLPAS